MLELSSVTFHYGHTPLYENLSLGFERGERVGLEAPSGFGKTTLCRLLAGYLQPIAGTVFLDGEPLAHKGLCPVQMIGQNPKAVLDGRRRLGDSLAEASDSLKSWRNMPLFGGAKASNPSESIIALLNAVGIRPLWLHRFPHELSGGELQRFCIARALLAQPSYVVADEITTMLDAVSTARLWHVIERYLKHHKAGLIFVSHDAFLTQRIATRVVNLTQIVNQTKIATMGASSASKSKSDVPGSAKSKSDAPGVSIK